MARRQKRDAEYSASVAQSLQSKRTKISTKRTYHSKVNAMTAWLALHFPQTIDSITKKMLIPLPKEAILDFLGISVVLLTCVTAITWAHKMRQVFPFRRRVFGAIAVLLLTSIAHNLLSWTP
ncbi:hypothetical protein GN958_ATG01932 [Phytophthora infestans]|uniref:Transmembrane protein n=1 Tax=Phytophthora infestans TaxID=4787 RepID=A0A8S9VE09_PHYIN|nr:hypothetical protein GN958_ATG01932 [Phytophthora infestans]